MQKIALSIAGSDPSGGAGIQADLKVFHSHKVFGTSVISLLTAQNTLGVEDVEIVSHQFFLAQLKTLTDDILPNAAKTGALGNAEIVDVLIFQLPRISKSFPLVVDPILFSSSGKELLDYDGKELVRNKLIELAYVVIPNLQEAEFLSEREVNSVDSMKKAAKSISLRGPKNVLVTGGHLLEEAVDVFFCDGEYLELRAPKLATKNTHGTGCALSAAITANLALGLPTLDCIKRAKDYVTHAIESAPDIGKGNGPLNLL